MARIAGVDLPREKRVQVGLTEGLTFMMLNLLLVDALTLIWSAR